MKGDDIIVSYFQHPLSLNLKFQIKKYPYNYFSWSGGSVYSHWILIGMSNVSFRIGMKIILFSKNI